MRGVRGKDIAMIFQEPMTSLNPVLTIGSQIAEVLLLHEPISQGAGAGDKAVDCFAWSASRSRNSAPRNIRTSFPAACGSA